MLSIMLNKNSEQANSEIFYIIKNTNFLKIVV